MTENYPGHSIARAALVPLRIYMGVVFLVAVWPKLTADGSFQPVLNYMLTKGAWFWTPASNDAAFFFICLTLLLGAAGRVWGVDRVLHERYPRVPLW